MDEDDYQPDDGDEMQELFDACGQTQDGTCQLAGTEYCDFECPFRDA